MKRFKKDEKLIFKLLFLVLLFSDKALFCYPHRRSDRNKSSLALEFCNVRNCITVQYASQQFYPNLNDREKNLIFCNCDFIYTREDPCFLNCQSKNDKGLWSNLGNKSLENFRNDLKEHALNQKRVAFVLDHDPKKWYYSAPNFYEEIHEAVVSYLIPCAFELQGPDIALFVFGEAVKQKLESVVANRLQLKQRDFSMYKAALVCLSRKGIPCGIDKLTLSYANRTFLR